MDNSLEAVMERKSLNKVSSLQPIIEEDFLMVQQSTLQLPESRYTNHHHSAAHSEHKLPPSFVNSLCVGLPAGDEDTQVLVVLYDICILSQDT